MAHHYHPPSIGTKEILGCISPSCLPDVSVICRGLVTASGLFSCSEVPSPCLPHHQLHCRAGKAARTRGYPWCGVGQWLSRESEPGRCLSRFLGLSHPLQKYGYVCWAEQTWKELRCHSHWQPFGQVSIDFPESPNCSILHLHFEEHKRHEV